MHPRIYRLVTREEWIKAQSLGYIPRSATDERSGFVHLSPKDQVLESANRYFTPEQGPVVAEIDTQALGDTLKWEAVPSRNNALFPHLYGHPIPLEAVRCLIELTHNPEAQFAWGESRSLK